MLVRVVARGFARSGQGNPDEARASRYILKDYVNAKLLYCHPPPDVNDEEFNAETQELTLRRLMRRKRAPVTRVGKNADTFIATPTSNGDSDQPVQSNKLRALDASFFESGSSLSARPFIQGSARHGQQFSRGTTYPHQNMLNDDGTRMNRKARMEAMLAAGGEGSAKGKKHFKGHKKVKQRSGKGYD